MIWNKVFTNLKRNEKIKISYIYNTKTHIIQKKNIINVFKKFSQKNKIDVVKNFIKNNQKNKFTTLKTDYKKLIFKKINIKIDRTEFLKKILILSLNTKQMYCNILENEKNTFFLTNGIVTKENEILEKKRKKELKFTIINLNKTLSKLKISNCTINIRKLRPSLSKILKIIKIHFKKNENKLNLIISPKIPFSFEKFKKVKSIKRRLRKKYKLLDL